MANRIPPWQWKPRSFRDMLYPVAAVWAFWLAVYVMTKGLL